MKRSILLLAGILLTTGGVSLAGTWAPSKNLIPLAPPVVDTTCLSYDFIDLEYVNREFGSGYFSKGSGYGVGFSKLLTETIYLDGSYSFSEFDDRWCGCFDEPETHRYRLGLGVRRPLAECVDLTFDGGMEYIDTEYGRKTDRTYDSWGYYFGPGIRAKMGRIEVFAKAHYFHREGDYSQNHIDPQFRSGGYSHDPYGWRFSTGFIYHVTERFGIKVAGEFEDYDNTFFVGGRYHF